MKPLRFLLPLALGVLLLIQAHRHAAREAELRHAVWRTGVTMNSMIEAAKMAIRQRDEALEMLAGIRKPAPPTEVKTMHIFNNVMAKPDDSVPIWRLEP